MRGIRVAIPYSGFVHTASINQASKQARQPEFYKYTRLPVTRWVTNTINDQFDRNAILTVYK